VPDRPGGLAGLLQTIAAAGANVIELSHARDDADLPLAQTGVEMLLELRGEEHADALAERLGAAGYQHGYRYRPEHKAFGLTHDLS
jgi:threonine dehydratase